MRECVARLIKCGFSREVALAICRSYAKNDDWKGMRAYVKAVEEENMRMEEEEW